MFPAQWEVFVATRRILLTQREFGLLRSLLRASGAVVSREDLLADNWMASEVSVQTRTVDVHLSRLKQKLGVEGNTIKNVRNIGYRIELPRECYQ